MRSALWVVRTPIHVEFKKNWIITLTINCEFSRLKLEIWGIYSESLFGKRPVVMHTAKREKCQIFRGMEPPRIGKFLNAFLSVGLEVVEWTPQDLTSGGNFGNSTFPCTVQWCMQICHKPFSHHLRAIWKCKFTLFSIENADLKWL